MQYALYVSSLFALGFLPYALRKSENGDLDASGVTEFSARHREPFSHENRLQREDERGEHGEDIGGDDSGIVFHAGFGIFVSGADGNGQRQQPDHQRRQKQLECGVQELLRLLGPSRSEGASTCYRRVPGFHRF